MLNNNISLLLFLWQNSVWASLIWACLEGEGRGLCPEMEWKQISLASYNSGWFMLARIWTQVSNLRYAPPCRRSEDEHTVWIWVWWRSPTLRPLGFTVYTCKTSEEGVLWCDKVAYSTVTVYCSLTIWGISVFLTCTKLYEMLNILKIGLIIVHLVCLKDYFCDYLAVNLLSVNWRAVHHHPSFTLHWRGCGLRGSAQPLCVCWKEGVTIQIALSVKKSYSVNFSRR